MMGKTSFLSRNNSVPNESISIKVTIKLFGCRLGHYTVPREMDEVSNWLSSRLGLGASS